MDTQAISIAVTAVLDENGLVWLDAMGSRCAGANWVMANVVVERVVRVMCMMRVIGVMSRVGAMMTAARERWGGKDGHRQEGGAYEARKRKGGH